MAVGWLPKDEFVRWGTGVFDSAQRASLVKIQSLFV